jgi:hypothetical protein
VARDLDFGLARMFEAFREHPATTVRVFRGFDEALSWARAAPERGSGPAPEDPTR